MLKSTDGEATWELVGDRDLDGFAFSDLAVDPATSLTIVGATARGTHVLNSYQKPTGIYRSTDGGARWTRMLVGQATDLEVDPSDFNRQVAGIGEIFGDEAQRAVSLGRRRRELDAGRGPLGWGQHRSRRAGVGALGFGSALRERGGFERQ